MQGQSGFGSQPLGLFRAHALEELPQIYSWFEEMRAHHPVFYDERIWHVFRYEDVLTVLTDYTRFSSEPLAGFTASFLIGDLQHVEGVPITVRMGIVFVIGSLPMTFQPC